MATLEEALRKRYPTPEEAAYEAAGGKYVKVIISEGHCTECGSGGFEFFEPSAPESRFYFGRGFEVPQEWLARWKSLSARIEYLQDELQDELEKVYHLPAGRGRISPPGE